MSKKNKKKTNSRLSNNSSLYYDNSWILEEIKKRREEDNVIYQTKDFVIREKPKYYKKSIINTKIALLALFSLFFLVLLVGSVVVFENKVLNSKKINITTNNEQKKETNNDVSENKDDTSVKAISDEDVKDPITKIPVFTFHRLVTAEVKEKVFPNGEWANNISVFEKQMEYLYNNGYKTLSMDELYCWYIKKCQFPKKSVVLTFDDGDYDIYYLGLSVFKKYNFKATMFTVGSYIATKTYNYDPYIRHYIGMDLIKDVQRTYPNLEFQSHTYNLHHIDSNKKEALLNMNYNELSDDYKKNSKYGFKYIAYPYGIYTPDMEKLAKENNYLLGFRFRNSDYATRNSDQYALPRIKINGYMSVDDMIKWLN